MTDEQRRRLVEKVKVWRKIAEPVGPLHSLWGCIFDAESLLAGRRSVMTVEELLKEYE